MVVIRRITGSRFKTPPIYSPTILHFRYPSPRRGAPSHSEDTSACGTPLPAGARTGRCRGIALKRLCRDLSHECTKWSRALVPILHSRTSTPQSDRQTGPTKRVCRSPSPIARPVVLAREGPPSLVNRHLITEALVPLMRR